MHILITGAAGMIGRKLTARLVEGGRTQRQPIEKLTLTDIGAPQRPEEFAGSRRRVRGRHRRPDSGRAMRRRAGRT